jgi:hypothetical protein
MKAAEIVRQRFDHFWMKPHDLRILDVIRRGYGLLLILYVVMLWPDRHRFFGTGSWVPPETGRQIVDPDTFDLYSYLPDYPIVITLVLLLVGLCGVCLIASCFPRPCAALTMFLLTSVQHANVMLFDSEDVVFRLFAFFLVFVPPWRRLKKAATCGASSPDALASDARGYPAWPLRFFQLQLCIIYLAAGIQKSSGAEWIDGTAIYYALRLDDMTKFPLPEFMTEKIVWSRLLSWSTVAFEILFPFLVWTRRLRWPCLWVAFGFHLGTEYALNLHLFHPIMMLGLLSFVKFEEWQWLVNAVRTRILRQKIAVAEPQV